MNMGKQEEKQGVTSNRPYKSEEKNVGSVTCNAKSEKEGNDVGVVPMANPDIRNRNTLKIIT